MALVFLNRNIPDTLVGVWKVEERIEDLLSLYPYLQIEITKYTNVSKQLNKLCEYMLLYGMTGEEGLFVEHDMRGKPLLKNWNISMSDTRGYVAICLSRTCRVGVDIEYLSNRVSKIAERFIRTDEQARDVREQLLHWCAKETVYKYYSEQILDYFEMRLKTFEMAEQGTVAVENLKNMETLPVSYLFMDKALLTYSVG